MNGFTLIETIVVISILVGVSVLVTFGWPRIRAYQSLLLSEQRVESLIATARERALNEDRDSGCLATVTSDNERRCSDIGVALQDTTVILFADTQANSDRYTPGQDYILSTETIPAQVTGTAGSWYSLLFKASPPTATLYAQGSVVTSDAPASFGLQAGTSQIAFTISPYGNINRNE